DEQLAKIPNGQRVDRENFAGRVETLALEVGRLSRRRRQQIAHRITAAVAQIGEGVTEQLQQGDARIVDVVIGPQTAAQLLDVVQAPLPQPGIVLGRIQRRVLRDGYAVHHVPYCVMLCPVDTAETRML